MPKAAALVRTIAGPADWLRSVIVLGCAAALILAERFLPVIAS